MMSERVLLARFSYWAEHVSIVQKALPFFIKWKGFLMILYKTSYRCNRSVSSIITDFNSIARVGCMNNLSISHVNCNMASIADQVTWLCICIGYFNSCILLLIGGSWKAYTKVRIHTLYKSRTISTTGKTRSAPYIWVADKLSCIIHYRRA